MGAASEREAAYFTLLRAIEERDGLLRYRELLDVEAVRLDEVAAATRAPQIQVPPKIRRTLDATAKPLLTAIGRRRTVVEDERRRVEDRLEAAEAFVAECEADYAALV